MTAVDPWFVKVMFTEVVVVSDDNVPSVVALSAKMISSGVIAVETW